MGSNVQIGPQTPKLPLNQIFAPTISQKFTTVSVLISLSEDTYGILTYLLTYTFFIYYINLQAIEYQLTVMRLNILLISWYRACHLSNTVTTLLKSSLWTDNMSLARKAGIVQYQAASNTKEQRALNAFTTEATTVDTVR